MQAAAARLDGKQTGNKKKKVCFKFLLFLIKLWRKYSRGGNFENKIPMGGLPEIIFLF